MARLSGPEREPALQVDAYRYAPEPSSVQYSGGGRSDVGTEPVGIDRPLHWWTGLATALLLLGLANVVLRRTDAEREIHPAG